MKLIIDLPDETYKEIRWHGLKLCPRDEETLLSAIKNAVRLNPDSITNADRVRAMSDEELSAWLVNPEPLKKYLRDEIGLPRYISPSESDILGWLKMESEGE